MWYTYVFNTDIDEQPYAVWDGNIKYVNVEVNNCIKVNMDIDDNIDFEAGIIGEGFDTSNIKDYKTLLAFLKEHYDEIEEPEECDNPCGITRRDCIDELIAVCNEKYKKI